MGMPTLEQLLHTYRDHDLPEQPEAEFKDAKVEDLPVCATGDNEKYRMFGYKKHSRNVIFFPANSKVSGFSNVDTQLYARFLSATGGLLYQAKDEKGGGNHTYKLNLCRKAAPSPGLGATPSYEVYAIDRMSPVLTNNGILNHHPDLNLRPVDFDFRPEEIIALVRGGQMDMNQYRTNPAFPNRLSINPDVKLVDRLIALVRDPKTPIEPKRRKEIEDALNQAVKLERQAVELAASQKQMAQEQMNMQKEGFKLQQGMRGEMRWQMIAMGALTVYTTLLALGKAKTINYLVSFLPRAVVTPLVEGGVNLYNAARGRPADWRWTERFFGDAMSRVRYRAIPTLLQIGTNLTEMARKGEIRPVADDLTPEVAQKIENTLNSKFNTMSVLVEGPPGWGKEILMRELARRNPGTVYIQVTPNAIMGGTEYRGQLEQRITNISRELTAARKNGQNVVLCIDEFHEALSAGKSRDQTVSLLENFKGELARGEIRIAGFSTPRELLKARYIAGIYNDEASLARLSPEFQAEVAQFRRDGEKQSIELRALLRRFQPVALTPRSEQNIVDILKDKVAERAEGHGLKIDMSKSAMRRIAQLSESPIASEGFIPRDALAIFNGVIDAHLASGSNEVRLTTQVIDDYVAKVHPEIARRFDMSPPPKAGGGEKKPVEKPKPEAERVKDGAAEAKPLTTEEARALIEQKLGKLQENIRMESLTISLILKLSKSPTDAVSKFDGIVNEVTKRHDDADYRWTPDDLDLDDFRPTDLLIEIRPQDVLNYFTNRPAWGYRAVSLIEDVSYSDPQPPDDPAVLDIFKDVIVAHLSSGSNEVRLTAQAVDDYIVKVDWEVARWFGILPSPKAGGGEKKPVEKPKTEAERVKDIATEVDPPAAKGEMELLEDAIRRYPEFFPDAEDVIERFKKARAVEQKFSASKPQTVQELLSKYVEHRQTDQARQKLAQEAVSAVAKEVERGQRKEREKEKRDVKGK